MSIYTLRHFLAQLAKLMV